MGFEPVMDPEFAAEVSLRNNVDEGQCEKVAVAESIWPLLRRHE
jgi:hypothetical protein